MSSIVTILNPADMYTYGRVDKTFPLCDARGLFNYEYFLFRSCCLGHKFLDILKADLVDYSSTASWDNTATYTIGQQVHFRSTFYEVIVATTTKQPTVHTDWKLAKRFTTEIYDDLYCMFLAEYLSLYAVKNTIPTIDSRISHHGVISFAGDSFNVKEKGDLNRVYVHIDKLISIVYGNMEHWITNEADDGSVAFDETGLINTNLCSCGELKSICQDSCTKRKRQKNYPRVAGAKRRTPDILLRNIGPNDIIRY